MAEHFAVSQPFWSLALVCPHGQRYLSKRSPLGEGLGGDSQRDQGIRLTQRWGIVMVLPIGCLPWVTTPQLALVTGSLASPVVRGRPLQNQLSCVQAFHLVGGWGVIPATRSALCGLPGLSPGGPLSPLPVLCWPSSLVGLCTRLKMIITYRGFSVNTICVYFG